MTWVYRQRTGELLHEGRVIAIGYSGHDDGDGVPEPGEGKNDPAAQAVRSVGPIPVGRYTIGPPHTHPTAGPYTMRLTPQAGTETFGRSGFLIHGDSRSSPGAASLGCIILARPFRVAVWMSGDVALDVVADAPNPHHQEKAP